MIVNLEPIYFSTKMVSFMIVFALCPVLVCGNHHYYLGRDGELSYLETMGELDGRHIHEGD